MPSSRRKTSTAAEIKIGTGQKVMIGVALLAGLGAVAAGFASLPSRNPCDGKIDGKQDGKYDGKPDGKTDGKSAPCDGKQDGKQDGKPDGKDGKGISTIQTMQKMQFVRIYPGMLIKPAHGTTIFYVGADFKRYTFFSYAIFNSWNSSFKTITAVPDEQVANLPVGGLVHVRPGSMPLKSVGSPDVYTTTKGGVLHKIGSEKLAQDYYGATWSKKILVLPDVVFATYTLGDQVGSQTKETYSPATQLATVMTIDQDLGLTK